MTKTQEQLDAIHDIRQMMKQSSRFLSLSGLSGVMAGLYALAGAYAGYGLIEAFKTHHVYEGYTKAYQQLLWSCVGICAVVLLLSIVTAILFSYRKARSKGYKLIDHTSIRLIINMLIPLASGAVFCLALLVHGGAMLGLVAPSMLIFYGLALINGSKYTLHDIRYLGLLEISLGLISCFFMNHGILFWSLGFGLLHIVYGSIMWFKYERKQHD